MHWTMAEELEHRKSRTMNDDKLLLSQGEAREEQRLDTEVGQEAAKNFLDLATMD